MNGATCLLFVLTFTTLLANSADGKLVIVFIIFQKQQQQQQKKKQKKKKKKKKTGFNISCKLSPMETICIKCEILFTRKNKKNISKCLLLKILPRLLSVNSQECMSRAVTLENMPSDRNAQRRFRSACAFVQFDKNLHWTIFLIAKDAIFYMRTMKTLIRLLIWVFVGQHVKTYAFLRCDSSINTQSPYQSVHPLIFFPIPVCI